MPCASHRTSLPRSHQVAPPIAEALGGQLTVRFRCPNATWRSASRRHRTASGSTSTQPGSACVSRSWPMRRCRLARTSAVPRAPSRTIGGGRRPPHAAIGWPSTLNGRLRGGADARGARGPAARARAGRPPRAAASRSSGPAGRPRPAPRPRASRSASAFTALGSRSEVVSRLLPLLHRVPDSAALTVWGGPCSPLPGCASRVSEVR